LRDSRESGFASSRCAGGLLRLGPDWFRVESSYGDDSILETFVHREEPSGWRYAAAIHHHWPDPYGSWRADFLERPHDILQRMRIRSLNWIGETDGVYDLTLTRDFVSLDNADPVPPEVAIAPTATETTLADLKSSLPLIIAPLPRPNVRGPARDPRRR
jgi:hypothetical protein